MYVVIMLELRREGEPKLSVSQQINEVFGPFKTDEDADAWVAEMQETITNREWIILPLSDTNTVRILNPSRN